MSESADTIDALVDWAHNKVHEWLAPMEAGDYVRAAEIAIAAIRDNRNRPLGRMPLVYRQTQFGVRVLLNALRDLANVKIIVTHDRWISSPPAVEAVWHTAHDARERLLNYSGIEEEFLTYCLDELKPVFEAIKAGYGHGLYSSWELVLDGLTCSICNSDIRGCDHIPGQWYGEDECKQIPEGGYIRAVSLVKYPADPRCRLWPWLNRSESQDGHTVIEDIPIYMIFTPEGDEDGGQVVDPRSLFGPQPRPNNIPRAKANLALDEPNILDWRLGRG